jgi:hypothetical protein
MFRHLLFNHFYRVHMMAQWFRRHFTPAGHLLLAAMSFSAVLGIDTNQTLAYQLFTLTAALLLLSVTGSWLCRKKCKVRRILPPYATVGEVLVYQVEIENQGRTTQHSLALLEHLPHPRISFAEFSRLGLGGSGNFFDDYVGYPRWRALMEQRRGARVEEQVVPPLLPRTHSEVQTQLIPWRRGYLHFSALSLVCPDPLGIFKTLRRHNCPGKLLVLPKRYPVPDLKLVGHRRYQPGGVSLALAIGDSTEFVALREYRPGDPLRHIHWKSWARRGKPIVKEFQDEFFTRHALILDTFAERDDNAAFEEAVAVSASFVCGLLNQDTLLDMIFVGAKPYHFTGGRGLSHLDGMLEILACVEAQPAPGFAMLHSALVPHLRLFSACICVLLKWDAVRQTLLQTLRAADIEVIALVIGEAPPDVEMAQVYFLRPGHIAEDLQRVQGV